MQPARLAMLLVLFALVALWTARTITNTAVDNPNTALELIHPRVETVLDHPDFYVYPRQCATPEKATVASVTGCYPGATLQKPWQLARNNMSAERLSFCDDLADNKNQPLTWKALQQCWSGRRMATKFTGDDKQEDQEQQTYEIHVIGERNSGTKWLQQELSQCFPRDLSSKIRIRCHRDFLRSKHFFQPPVRGVYANNIVIAIVRDPIEWVAAMREKPYHMPYHMAGFDKATKKMLAIPLDWETFVQRAEWTYPQTSPHDLNVLQSKTQNSVACVQGFSFDQVTPCIFDNSTIPTSKWRGHMPIYELSRDTPGKPFANLLKLRSDKILNFVVEIPLLMQLGGYWVVRYEDLLRDGTRPLLEQMADMMGIGLPQVCRPQPPRPERIGHREIPEGFRQWIEEHLVLETEQLLGYR